MRCTINILMAVQDNPLSIFADPVRAERNLKSLYDLVVVSGMQSPVEDFAAALESRLSGSPDPDMAITNLLRFTEATMSKASLFGDLVKYPPLMDVLVTTFGFSQYFADILVRDPELFRWLTASDVLLRKQAQRLLLDEVERTFKMFVQPDRRLDALKRLYRREILRIGVRDILGNADLRVVTEELSDLADSMVKSSCRVAAQQVNEKFGPPPETPYAVIGLGKLGGRELNYSSDIDVLFVYKDEGERDGVSFHQYFNKFVERMVQNLSQSTTEGHFYRVDTRLRPESGAGPLARSLKSYLLYYESRGELWERQMLIKARPVAGDEEFGGEFLGQLEPFVYPRTFFRNPSESIARIKARIEAAIGDEENVKLWSGGIRDVEFIVQSLQLVNGGKNQTIRGANTLHTLELLSAEQFLSKRESEDLATAYTFFRTLEHRLQTMLNTQTHSMPKDEAMLHTLARRMGFSSSGELRQVVGEHRSNVKRIFQDVLSVDATEEHPDILTVIDGGSSQERIGEALRRYGFQDIHQASKNLMYMLSGSSLSETRELDLRSRESIRAIAGDLFRDIGETPNPNMTLANLVLLVGAQKFPDQFYRQLEEDGFRRLVVSVCATSPRFAKGLAADQLLFEEIAGSSQMLNEGFAGLQDPREQLSTIKRREEMRAGIRYVLGVIAFSELTSELSTLADAVVTSVLASESSTKRMKSPPLAIFALGKYGTKEITFDADLDIIFVADSRSPQESARLEKLASSTMQRLSALSSEGKLYDVDARLRPEGKNAPLVVDSLAYATYLKSRSSLWERQSLTRLRFVSGDQSIADHVARSVDAFVYHSPLPENWVETIVAMRRKTETRSLTQSTEYFDFKLGAGGMVDIEFLAQIIQLRFAAEHPELKGLPTCEVIRKGREIFLSVADSDRLIEAYQLYRRLETLHRITLEDRSTILPDGEKLELLAGFLDRRGGETLKIDVAGMMKEVRTMFISNTQHVRSL